MTDNDSDSGDDSASDNDGDQGRLLRSLDEDRFLRGSVRDVESELTNNRRGLLSNCWLIASDQNPFHPRRTDTPELVDTH